MSGTSVGEVSGALPVVGDGGDHWYLQGFGDLTSLVRLPSPTTIRLPAIGGTEPRMITERRQMDSGTHDRPQRRGNDDGSQCTALQQCGRWSVRPEPTAVDDHVEIDVT